MKKRPLIFAAACIGMLLFGITLITLGSAATDLAKRYSLTDIDTGALFSILPIGIIAGSLIFGPVSDKYGYKLLLIAACLAMFAGFQGIAHAPDLSFLKWSIFFFGLGGGIINGATNALVADISDTHKVANLSILGIFFGIGALFMPVLIGALNNYFSPPEIISSTGWATLLVAFFYAFVPFPKGKVQKLNKELTLKKLFSPLLIIIAFFLFFQSSLEAIINNWTTTYLVNRTVMDENEAIYALSFHVAGMVAMRLLMGAAFRNTSQYLLMLVCIIMIFAGIWLMESASQLTAITGLIFSGAGLAGGFPIMLGIAGERFPEISGKAFSVIFVIALAGNMLINYLMGRISVSYGINHLTTVSYIEAAMMLLLLAVVYFKYEKNSNQQ